MLLTIGSVLLIALGLVGRLSLAYRIYSEARDSEEDSRE